MVLHEGNLLFIIETQEENCDAPIVTLPTPEAQINHYSHVRSTWQYTYTRTHNQPIHIRITLAATWSNYEIS